MTRLNGRGEDGSAGSDPLGAAGWLTFEARMRGRRFARCVERAGAALEAGNLDESRAAAEEARALFPNAPEIADLERRLAERQSQPLVVGDRFVEEPDEVVISTPAAATIATAVPDSFLRSTHMPPPSAAGRGVGFVGTSAAFTAVFGLIGYGLAQLYIDQQPHAMPRVALESRADAGAAVRTPATSAPAPSTPTPPIASEPVAAERVAGERVAAERSERIAPPSAQPEASAQPQPPVQTPAPARPDRSLPPSSPRSVAPPSIDATAQRAAANAQGSRPPSLQGLQRERGTQPERGTQDARPASPPPMATGSRGTNERPESAATPALDLPERPKPSPPSITDPAPPAVNAVATTGTAATTGTTVPPLPEAPPVVNAALRSTPATAAAAAPAARVDETPMIRVLLARYETAYNRLDAAAASSVYPRVNREALDRAFGDLVSQKVSLGVCDITVIGDIGGASCAGKARWEPRVGGGTRTADRHWKFNLRRGEDGWRIEQVLVR